MLPALRLQDTPKIVFDGQFVGWKDVKLVQKKHIGGQVLNTIRDNCERQGFEMEFVNMDVEDPLIFHWLKRNAGAGDQLGNSSHLSKPNDTDITYPVIRRDNPYRYANESGDDVVYLSRWAREMIDGPITAKTIIIPLTFDNDRQTRTIQKEGNFRVMRLPLDKYFRWKTGTKALAINNILNVLFDVSHGDTWETALRKYVSNRHLTTLEERGFVRQMLWKLRQERLESDKKVFQMVHEGIQESDE